MKVKFITISIIVCAAVAALGAGVARSEVVTGVGHWEGPESTAAVFGGSELDASLTGWVIPCKRSPALTVEVPPENEGSKGNNGDKERNCPNHSIPSSCL